MRKPPTWESKARTGSGELLHNAAGEDLALLLVEANELYQQGLHILHRQVAAHLGGLTTEDLMCVAERAGVQCQGSQDRDEVILLQRHEGSRGQPVRAAS
ncbi:hypothetical protein ACWD3K_35950 [Streptomyces sp. NPDC002778]